LPDETRFISDDPVDSWSDFEVRDFRSNPIAETPETIQASEVLRPLRFSSDRSEGRIGLYKTRTWVAWRRHLALVMLADVLELISVTNP
jgi:hypothetical protein